MRKLSFLLLALLAFTSAVFAQTGDLRGKITDAKTKEGIPFAAVVVLSNGSQVAGTKTDIDGKFTIRAITPGTYDIKVSSVGYGAVLSQGIKVVPNNMVDFNQTLEVASVVTKTAEVKVERYKEPVFRKDQSTTGATLSKEDINKMSARDLGSIASSSSGVYQKKAGDGMNFKGGRETGTRIIVDGVPVIGGGNGGLSRENIEQVSVLTGGIPAEFGDFTGGAISVTTKGPSKNYSGGLEGVTSSFIGRDGYNLASGSLSGPILLKNKGQDNERSLLGFSISGEYLNHQDPDLPALQVYKLKDAKLKEVQENPLVVNPNADPVPALTYQSGEYVTFNDLEKVKRRQNVGLQAFRPSVKLSFQPTLLTNITVGASGEFQRYNKGDEAWPGGNDLRFLFNVDKNPLITENTFRVFARYTQRFGNQATDTAKSSLIKNAYYSIQADYSQYSKFERDETLGDDFFKYGYVGKFTSYKAGPRYKLGQTVVVDSVEYKNVTVFDGYEDSVMTIEPSAINPVLGNYAAEYKRLFGNPLNYNDYRNRGGLINGDAPAAIFGLYDNVGRQTGFRKDLSNQLRFTFKFSADIKKHSIQAGFEYEQRNDRTFSPFPRSLWQTMYLLTNSHIKLSDTSFDLHEVSADPGIDAGDTLRYHYVANAKEQSYFDYNLRKKLGVSDTTFIDVNALDPSFFSLDMFSANELITTTPGNAWTYSGYDYKGNPLSGKVNFLDFFSDSINRPMASYNPIYMAGYIQDKFSLTEDFNIRLGVRIDRFDANQMVLKDKYSLFNVKTVAETPGERNERNGNKHPGNMGSDYVVYVSSQEQTQGNTSDGIKITGYRNGDDFYNAYGKKVENPTELNDQDGRVTPLFGDDVVFANKLPRFKDSYNGSFRDYKPQVTVNPRVSFSFAISDEAVFFANYDVLSQRPQTAPGVANFVYSSPLDYFLLDRGNDPTLTNPNLRPERTIDYQLGFKQKLSKSSALTVTAFYRSMKDQIQQIKVLNAYPFAYTSYANRDFGNVKGATFDYDLRRTGNATIRLSYTLQFAEGTGSSVNSSQNLLNAGLGNILIPLSLNYDQRHTFVTNLDYRFPMGKEYTGNGPDRLRWLLDGAGTNIMFRAGSGTPYSRQIEYTSIGADSRFRTLNGTINGSRLPWAYTIDIRIDRNFQFSKKAENNSATKNPINLNLYLVVQNVLNTLNITNVYNTTGNPDDDGFLNTVTGQQEVNKQVSAQSYTDLYLLRMKNPANYSAPRLLRLGAIINF